MKKEDKLKLFRDLIAEIGKLQPLKRPFEEAKLNLLEEKARLYIRRFCPEPDRYYNMLRDINLDKCARMAQLNLNIDAITGENSLQRGIDRFRNIITIIMEDIDLQQEHEHPDDITAETITLSRNIFVVHGKDEEMKQAIARLLEQLDLYPIILHEMPNQGRTIIEKFEDYSDCRFAIILLSPDDELLTERAKPEETRLEKISYRSRQNVILELGYFIGKLGRKNVATLYKSRNNFEMPSDYEGIVYIEFDAYEGWKHKLAKELNAAGIKIDLTNLQE